MRLSFPSEGQIQQRRLKENKEFRPRLDTTSHNHNQKDLNRELMRIGAPWEAWVRLNFRSKGEEEQHPDALVRRGGQHPTRLAEIKNHDL